LKVKTKLPDRKTRRKWLFAPINIQYIGAKTWGGATTLDEESINEQKRASRGEYVQEFRRRSRIDGEDE
jgi:hypothetical protein